MRERLRLVTAAATTALVLAACGGGGSGGDVDAAIQNLVDIGLTEAQAQCVVDEFGEDRLDELDNFDPDFEPGADEEATLSAEIAEVFGACALGDGGGLEEPDEASDPATTDDETGSDDETPSEGEPAADAEPTSDDVSPGDWDCSDVDGPCVYGDDDALDALWDDCEEGGGAACDQLFFQSPVGSEYEDFGNSCGGRGVELSCEDVHGGGEDTGESEPSVTTGDIDCADVDGPCDYGDDAALDALWDDCGAGVPDACDELAFTAPSGSRYEQFGFYCGDRTEQVQDCSSIM